MEKRILCFDMDGTIADFYNVENWLLHLIAKNTTPYEIAQPMYNVETVNNMLNDMKENFEIHIVTWLSKKSTTTYGIATMNAKKTWLDKYDFPYDQIHYLPYGVNKATYISKKLKIDNAIIIDDDVTVRNKWNIGKAYNPKVETIENIILQVANG